MYEHVDLLHYELLSEEHGRVKYADVPPGRIEQYRGQVPGTLLAIWERYGLTSHGLGEVWFTDPHDFTEIVEALFGPERRFVVYARDSFGRMQALLGDTLYTILPQVARAVPGNTVEVFDFALASTLIRPASSAHKQHRLALRTLGLLEAHQLYGYVPVLASGGAGSLKDTQVVQMKAYLLMVAELATAALRRGWDPLSLRPGTPGT